ncbi:hypothetical protein, partial [Streptomyces sp. ISL-11]|uniref:hypothetical protein n=1 Tax=Streptomyces sp. ISL-11 TaxID=2819174 RepID=UPI001BE7D53F
MRDRRRAGYRAGYGLALATAAVLALTGEAAADEVGAHAVIGGRPVTAIVDGLPRLLPDHPPSHVTVNTVGGAVNAEVVDTGKGCVNVSAHVLVTDAEVWLNCRKAAAPPAPPAPAPPAPAPPAPAPPPPAVPPAPGAPAPG